MPKGLPQPVRDNLEKAKSAAIAAVDAYNRPGPRFRSAQFIVLMTMAWTGLFHAIFYRRGSKPWYRAKAKGGTATRYVKVDGEPKHWELAECLRHYYGDAVSPERKNLEFLVGLRNKIEHRHLPHLDGSLYGECQAALLNFESTMVAEFGQKHALAEQLGVALQFSQVLPDERGKALKAAARAAGAPVTSYIEGFRASLSPSVLESMKYSFAVYLVPRVTNREKAADAAVRFVKVDEASPEELERLQRLNVLIRDKHIPIANLNMLKPGEVVTRVAAALPHRFTLHHHTMAWQHYGVRPAATAAKRAATDARYCVYDAPHRDYVYTPAWAEKLSTELTDPEHFLAVTGQRAVPK